MSYGLELEELELKGPVKMVVDNILLDLALKGERYFPRNQQEIVDRYAPSEDSDHPRLVVTKETAMKAFAVLQGIGVTESPERKVEKIRQMVTGLTENATKIAENAIQKNPDFVKYSFIRGITTGPKLARERGDEEPTKVCQKK